MNPASGGFALSAEQRRAVDPHDSVWLSASAGTGKTQVLSARVLRLLLEPGVRPDDILCLTFSKAGAAEMANRVHQVLASWVRLEDTQLARELDFIGAGNDPATRQRARTLFAAVLDCPGGGLRIETIHAFAQWLLSAFPREAGLAPGMRIMDDRDRDLLAAQVLADCAARWQASDPAAMATLEELSLRYGPDGTRDWLMRCASARAAWFGPGAWVPPMQGRVAELLGLPAGVDRAGVASACADDRFPVASLSACAAIAARWSKVTGRRIADAIGQWLACDPLARLEQIELFAGSLFKKASFHSPDREIANLDRLERIDPGYGDHARQVAAALDPVIEQRQLLALVEWLTPALELGRRFALAWEEAKLSAGLVEFDDLIAHAGALLSDAGVAPWVRYKLDRQFHHILVDEAQDTNAAQWAIIDALTDEFFVGEGQAEDRLRTLFVVGDYKQAIFGFQGTSPLNFRLAFERYDAALRARMDAALQARSNRRYRPLQNLDLARSYRSAQDILNFVDDAIAAIGPDRFGLPSPPQPHVGDATRPGLIALWPPVRSQAMAADEGDETQAPGATGDGDEERTTAVEAELADRLALQIRRWWDEGFPLAKGGRRNAQPGDFMVLVRRRGRLAALIVARLYAAGVPVAGVDRLRLGSPLAVQDLLAALRFAVQPGDDLALACVLVSPLVGWSQEDLLRLGYRGERMGLWDHLQASSDPQAQAAVAMLRALLARADFDTPQALLHWILLGPWRGRARLLARLGGEAADPIDELINAAIQFAASHTPSLEGFLRWFDAGPGELKREADGAGNVVRVMTVHGAKGLQAPIVILADACIDPHKSPSRGLELVERRPGAADRPIPLPFVRKADRAGRLALAAEEARQAELQEHWRLLYVAMTRAEEALFIAGALGPGARTPASDSWYARLEPLFAAEPLEDPLWGLRFERGARPAASLPRTQAQPPIPSPLPAWATTPVQAEPRPPRPLAPSLAVADQGADPPLPASAARQAAERGVLIHALLERLPDVDRARRTQVGRAWLARHGAAFPAVELEAMLDQAIAVLDEPAFAALFGPQALAEVPLAAVVGEQVITGTVDRLLVEAERVLVADFKTARRPPASLDQVPASTLAQMAAYVAALEAIYPGRRVEASVLYTQVPRLMVLPAALLAPHKPGLAAGE